MNCRQANDYLDNVLITGPDADSEAALARHMETCPRCRRAHSEAMKTLSLLQPSSGMEPSTNLKERIMTRLNAAATLETRAPVKTRRVALWKPSLAFALAAMLVMVIAGFGLFQTAAPVYALEQTVAANLALRAVHMKMAPPHFGSVGEIWAEIDDAGTVQRLRMNFPDTEDGPKDVVWDNAAGKAQIWFKKKGSLVTVKEEKMIERLKMGFLQADPKQLVERLLQSKKGGADVTIDDSVNGGPITVTMKMENRMQVFKIDPQTKLLRQMEFYTLNNGQAKLEETTEYVDYNAPVAPAVFVLEAPESTLRIDQTAQDVGLLQGNLSDNESAIKTVREFYEALIARDFAKAGLLLGGLPAEKVQTVYENTQIVRIVSIGQPTPADDQAALRVPITLEYNENGQKKEHELRAVVRQVYNRPGHWEIIGGV